MQGNYTWSNMSGRKMRLGCTGLQTLSELECDALQKVALQRLAETDLGATIVVPKGIVCSFEKRHWRLGGKCVNLFNRLTRFIRQRELIQEMTNSERLDEAINFRSRLSLWSTSFRPGRINFAWASSRNTAFIGNRTFGQLVTISYVNRVCCLAFPLLNWKRALLPLNNALTH